MNSQLIIDKGRLEEGYKKTEVGLIPEDWEVKKLGEVSEFKQGYAFKSRDYTKDGIKLLKISNVGQNRIDWTDKSFLPKKYYDEYQTFELKENDIVMAMTRPIISTGIKVAKIRQVDTPCLLNQRVGKFISRDVYNNYIFHNLFSDNVIKRINVLISASQQPNISADQIESIKIPIPPLKEQKKIAIILSSVDEHIDEVDGMIEDLKELKKGLMQKLLTGQYSFDNSQLTIDNGQLKDKDMKLVRTKEFKKTKLGMIPKHWEVRKLSNLADKHKVNSFIDGDWIESEHIKNDGIRLIQTGNIGIGSFIEKEDKKYISEESYHLLKCKDVDPGDILICRLAEPTGRSCIAPDIKEKMITSVDIVMFKVNHGEYNSKFINYYLNTNKNLKSVERYEQGSTRKRISRKNLEKITLPIPPLQEQEKIASILSSVDERIELYENKKQDIEELKKGLMQQLLTGKKRVSIN